MVVLASPLFVRLGHVRSRSIRPPKVAAHDTGSSRAAGQLTTAVYPATGARLLSHAIG
jgi:hypothetical protein